jgi:sugar (pentulose or hexulose) kinase
MSTKIAPSRNFRTKPNFDILKHLLERDINALHIVGGGAKNRLLCTP